MTLAFPLSPEAFFAGLKVNSATFDLPDALEISRTASGEVLTADSGARLWSGQITLAQRYHAAAAADRARASVLREAGRSFFAHDTALAFPAADPDGALLGAATPLIATLPAGNRTLTLSSLPAGYVLSPGDMLGFTYRSNPVRHALHQIVTGATANGSGLTGAIEVTPAIRSGAGIGAAVTLVRACCKAVIVPGSVKPGAASGVFTAGLSFSFIQTLR